jgi:hypothetical protein
MKTCKNYRANEDSIQMPGACHPHQGQVIADLYNEDGSFDRSAVVADVGACGVVAARQYAKKMNELILTEGKQ